MIVGAPKGSANTSLDTGLVYMCPVAPGSCELMTDNTGALAMSMLAGVCVVLVCCAVREGGRVVHDHTHVG